MNYLRIVAEELREDLGWAESKVKRGPGGKFSSKGGGGKALTGLGGGKGKRRKAGLGAGGKGALLATGLAGAAGLGMMAMGARNASRPGNAPPPPRVAKPETPSPPTAAQRSTAQSHNSEVMQKGLEDLKGRIASGEYKRPKSTAEMIKEANESLDEFLKRPEDVTQEDLDELDEFMLGGPGGNPKKRRDRWGYARADFEESKHPREEDGKFAAKGGGSKRGSSLFPWQNMSDDDLDAAEAEMERQEQEEFAKEDKLAKRRDSVITPRGQYELRRKLGLTHDSALEYAGNPRNALIRELRQDFARAWSN